MLSIWQRDSIETADSALPFPGQYGYIIGQSFTATQAGTYDFSFTGNGDNLFSFFINGSISYANPMKQTITGGTQIGETPWDFQSIKILTGSAYLNAGTNWAYAVIDERGFSTGLLVAQSTFEAAAAVPEPAQVAASLLLLSGIGGYAFLKRRKAAKVALASCLLGWGRLSRKNGTPAARHPFLGFDGRCRAVLAFGVPFVLEGRDGSPSCPKIQARSAVAS